MAEKSSEPWPIPSHLLGWVVASSYKADVLEATVRCPCGCERLEFHYPGVTQLYEGRPHPCSAEIDGLYYFIIKAVCTGCRSEHLLFDGQIHGKADLIGVKMSDADLPRLSPWRCLECGSADHKGQVKIVSDYKDRYFEFGYAERFGADRWPDAYGWFAMTIQCAGCGYNTPEWISYETR